MFHITPFEHPEFDELFADAAPDGGAVPVFGLRSADLEPWLEGQPEGVRSWAQIAKFSGQVGQVVCVPGDDGLACVLLGLGNDDGSVPYVTGALPPALPAGIYRYEDTGVDSQRTPLLAGLGWAAGQYSYSRYKQSGAAPSSSDKARLVIPAGCDPAVLRAQCEGVYAIRDLVNTPANDMGPENLELAAKTLAEAHGGTLQVVRGSALLDENFPLVHAVGRAAAQEPRLIDITFGAVDAPKVTLVGKGVCFDTGGLNLKPDSAMALMKKDMGGAAHVLGLAHMILALKIKVRLRVIVPAVENAVSGSAFRPGDVYPSRKGLSVEIGNTDAEGRLVLADALALAGEDQPDLLIDLATLTGAARAALGPDLPPFYTPDERLAAEIGRLSVACLDGMWRMPLWPGYESWLESAIAGTNHIASLPFAGSITAALFLQKFVAAPARWLHVDIYAWTPKAKPGQPVGGEAQVVRALLELVRSRYPS